MNERVLEYYAVAVATTNVLRNMPCTSRIVSLSLSLSVYPVQCISEHVALFVYALHRVRSLFPANCFVILFVANVALLSQLRAKQNDLFAIKA